MSLRPSGKILILIVSALTDQGEFFNQAPQNNTQVVKSIFKEPAYRVLEKIKNRPYFKWQTRWVVIPPDEIRAYIVSIIMTKAT